MHDPVYLLSVKLRKALRRHVVNEKVVSDLRVGIDTFTVRLGNSLSKDSGVLRVKQKVDSCQLRVLFKTIPVSCKHFPFRVVGVNEHWTPFAATVFVFEQTLAWDWGEVSVSVETEGNPLFGKAAIVLGVVEGFKWKPVRRVGGSVAIVDTKFNQ